MKERPPTLMSSILLLMAFIISGASAYLFLLDKDATGFAVLTAAHIWSGYIIVNLMIGRYTLVNEVEE